MGPYWTIFDQNWKDSAGGHHLPIFKIQNSTLLDPKQYSNFDFYDIYLYIIHLYHEIQVTWYKQSYQKAIFNPENSQKVPKVAKFEDIWNLTNPTRLKHM